MAKSDQPKNSWGRGEAGMDEQAPAKTIDSVRQESQLSGVQGDGPSEFEVLKAPEGEKAVSLRCVKRYQ